MRYRDIIGRYTVGTAKLPAVPLPPARLSTDGRASIQLRHLCRLDSALPAAKLLAAPPSFENMGQSGGLMLVRMTLAVDPRGQRIALGQVHDYAMLYLNERYLGAISRMGVPPGFAAQHRVQALGTDLPTDMLIPADLALADESRFVLDVWVEAMGHINFNTGMNLDAKGLLGTPRLLAGDGSYTVLDACEVFGLPLDEAQVAALPPTPATGGETVNCFVGEFELAEPGDVYLDMRAWSKGMVWVNGHALGRYWSIGPQFALFCPGVWLKAGHNEIRVIDLHNSEAAEIPFCDGLSGKPI